MSDSLADSNTSRLPGPPADGWQLYALLLISGASLVLAFAPFELFWLAPLILALLLWLLEGADARTAARRSALFGLGMFTAGTYWLYISLNILGGLWPPFAALMMLAMIVANTAFVVAAAYLTARLSSANSNSTKDNWLRAVVIFPAAWVLFEWARGWVLTGFPFLSLGYGQVETPLGALAPVAGVYGVSWLTVLLAGALYAAVRGSWMNRIVVLLVVAGLLAGLQSQNQRRWTEDSGRDFNIGLVQGAIPQELKWRAEQLQPTLDLYLQLSLQMQNRDLIVWPEAAIPALPFEVSDYAATVNEAMSERGTQLFTGILSYDLERGEYANTLWALGAEQGLYKKRHLVMFGEYFPLPGFARRWLRVMNLPSENIAPGPRDQPPLMANGVAIAATICWELAFGAEQLDFLPQAGLLVNVSNDAWFGDTIMPHQHLQIGQMRARESGRFLLRSTNTGITAVVDPLGRVTHRIPQFEAGVLEATVKPHSGATPYVRAGNWPVISLVFLLLLASAARARAGVS